MSSTWAFGKSGNGCFFFFCLLFFKLGLFCAGFPWERIVFFWWGGDGKQLSLHKTTDLPALETNQTNAFACGFQLAKTRVEWSSYTQCCWEIVCFMCFPLSKRHGKQMWYDIMIWFSYMFFHVFPDFLKNIGLRVRCSRSPRTRHSAASSSPKLGDRGVLSPSAAEAAHASHARTRGVRASGQLGKEIETWTV